MLSVDFCKQDVFGSAGVERSENAKAHARSPICWVMYAQKNLKLTFSMVFLLIVLVPAEIHCLLLRLVKVEWKVFLQ